MAKTAFNLAAPALQIGFAHRLAALKHTHLQPALLATVAQLDIASLDRQLKQCVAPEALQKLASLGLRGESLFATPMVLTARPALLTYYRTLLGYSQKEFYKTGTGLGAFKRAEDNVEIRETAAAQLLDFCVYFNHRAWLLLQGLMPLAVDQRLLSDLSLLSIGPQLRGGSNNAKGEAGIGEVFKIILSAVAHAKPKVSARSATFTNATGRTIEIEIASDPDVIIQEKFEGQVSRPVLAIEVKAGTDASNIHNRIGEAEKSHLKAKADGFTECWTIVNVTNLDPVKAKQQSPTTHRFFELSELLDGTSEAHKTFTALIVSMVAIKVGKPKPARSKKR